MAGEDDHEFHYEPFNLRETGRWTRTNESATTFGLLGRTLMTIPAIVLWIVAIRLVTTAEGPMAALLMVVVGILTIVVVIWCKEIWQKGWTKR